MSAVRQALHALSDDDQKKLRDAIIEPDDDDDGEASNVSLEQLLRTYCPVDCVSPYLVDDVKPLQLKGLVEHVLGKDNALYELLNQPWRKASKPPPVNDPDMLYIKILQTVEELPPHEHNRFARACGSLADSHEESPVLVLARNHLEHLRRSSSMGFLHECSARALGFNHILTRLLWYWEHHHAEHRPPPTFTATEVNKKARCKTRLRQEAFTQLMQNWDRVPPLHRKEIVKMCLVCHLPMTECPKTLGQHLRTHINPETGLPWLTENGPMYRLYTIVRHTLRREIRLLCDLSEWNTLW